MCGCYLLNDTQSRTGHCTSILLIKFYCSRKIENAPLKDKLQVYTEFCLTADVRSDGVRSSRIAYDSLTCCRGRDVCFKSRCQTISVFGKYLLLVNIYYVVAAAHFLSAFAKLHKARISVVTSVRPSTCLSALMEQIGLHWMDFY